MDPSNGKNWCSGMQRFYLKADVLSCDCNLVFRLTDMVDLSVNANTDSPSSRSDVLSTTPSREEIQEEDVFQRIHYIRKFPTFNLAEAINRHPMRYHPPMEIYVPLHKFSYM